MTRQDRKALARQAGKQALAWPAHLTRLPERQWPAVPAGITRPGGVWRSRHYLACLFEAPPFGGVEVRRLTVNRVTLGGAGQWEDRIPWDDLQQCKREIGYGDWYAVEVYPRDRDLVNVAHMRHLWLLAEPLEIGWFRP
jgi:hypothetical protein